MLFGKELDREHQYAPFQMEPVEGVRHDDGFSFATPETLRVSENSNLTSNVRLKQLLEAGWCIDGQYHLPHKRKILIYLIHPGSGATARLDEYGTVTFIHDNGQEVVPPHENIWFNWVLKSLSRSSNLHRFHLTLNALIRGLPAFSLFGLNIYLILGLI